MRSLPRTVRGSANRQRRVRTDKRRRIERLRAGSPRNACGSGTPSARRCDPKIVVIITNVTGGSLRQRKTRSARAGAGENLRSSGESQASSSLDVDQPTSPSEMTRRSSRRVGWSIFFSIVSSFRRAIAYERVASCVTNDLLYINTRLWPRLAHSVPQLHAVVSDCSLLRSQCSFSSE